MDEMGKGAQHREEVALVTGSRRGIGLGIAMALAKGGFDVVLNGVSPLSRAREAINKVRSPGCRVEYFQADVSVEDDRGKLVTQIEEYATY